MKVKSLSPADSLATPWTAAYQAPPSMGFSRQEYWSGVPLPSPESCSVVSNSLQPHGKSGGKSLIAPERMKRLGQSGNDAQLWMCLVVKVKSKAIKNNISYEPGMLGP